MAYHFLERLQTSQALWKGKGRAGIFVLTSKIFCKAVGKKVIKLAAAL